MNKVWFITGAARGIGRAIAETALQNGDKVAFVYRQNIKPVADTFKNNIIYIKLNITDLNENSYNSAINKVIEKFGKIDYLVNNAGRGRITNFEETGEENIRELFEVNLFGMMRVTRAVLPIMRKQRSGHIFNISSGSSYCGGPAAYHTSKFAVTGFSASLAFELKPFGINVTNVVPGLIRTDFYAKDNLAVQPDTPIEDYDSNRWQTEFIKHNSNREQKGDPYKVAEIIYKAAYCAAPPLHLPVSADVIEVMEEWQKKMKHDLDVWKNKAIENK
ncbi:MAG: SDR family oxidoreductase [Christensenellales bacterium]